MAGKQWGAIRKEEEAFQGHKQSVVRFLKPVHSAVGRKSVMRPLSLLVLILPLVGGCVRPAIQHDSSDYDGLRVMVEVLHQIERHYLDPKPRSVLLESAVKEMTRFGNKDNLESKEEIPAGEASFESFAVAFTNAREQAQIPTAKLAVAAINGLLKPLDADSTFYPKALVKKQESKATTEFQALEFGIGYVRISGLDASTADSVYDAVTRLQGLGSTGLVLDLRDNSGGLLDATVSVTQQFIQAGRVLIAVNEREESRLRAKQYLSCPRTVIDLPMAVLINHGTAGGAEAMAGALQDWGRAALIGTETFGKGAVQTMLPLWDGSTIKLTTGKLYTPKGRPIDAKIQPDILSNEGIGGLLFAAIAYLRRLDLKHSSSDFHRSLPDSYDGNSKPTLASLQLVPPRRPKFANPLTPPADNKGSGATKMTRPSPKKDFRLPKNECIRWSDD